MFLILSSALVIGFIHTLIGPDHYVPLIAMAKVRNWRVEKTFVLTLICGMAHVLSAALIGIIAIAAGIVLAKLQFIETIRGNIAVWILISFGFMYLFWGLYKLLRKSNSHHHLLQSRKEITPWILCLIFVLGPCEPLIPLIMYPAIAGSMLNVLSVVFVFGIATIITMLIMVMAAIYSSNFLHNNFFTKYGNVMAGAVICGTGVAIKCLGL